LLSRPWLPCHAPGLHRGCSRLGAQYHHHSAQACGCRSGNRGGRGACVRDLALSPDEGLAQRLAAAGCERAMKERATTLRPLHAVSEMRLCVALQRIVWGYTELETVPAHIFVVAAQTGGQVLAAFDSDMPVGFALAFPALRKGQAYLHSHLLAVLPDYQNRGVGRRLKLAQRDEALARGIDLIEWTFDPLQLKNAWFNIAKLGAIVRRYVPDLYGRTSSPLHGGLPTDRLVAEGWLRSPPVNNHLSRKPGCEFASAEKITLPPFIPH